MTAKEFKRKLKKQSKEWYFIQGSRHELAMHPNKPGLQIAIQRGTGDIPNGTLNQMLSDAELK